MIGHGQNEKLKKVSVDVCYLDQVEDDNRRAKSLQHLVKMEGSYVGVWVSLVH